MVIKLYKYLEFERDGILIIFTLVSTVAAGLVPPALAILTGRVFNSLVLSEKHENTDILVRSMAIMALGGASLPTTWASISAWMLLGERCGFGIRRRLLYKYLENPFEWYDKTEDICGNFTQQNRCVEEARASCAEASAVITRSLVTIIALIGTSFYASWSLTLVTLCSAPLIIMCGWFFSRKVQRYADLENEQTSKASQLLDWSMTAAQFIRLSGTELREIKSFKNCVQNCTNNFVKMCQYSSINLATLKFLSLAMFVQAFWFGSTMIRKGKMNIGDVITCFHSCILLGSTISGTLQQLVIIQKGSVAVNQVSKFLADDKTATTDIRRWQDVPFPELKGDIRFQNVEFSYPSRPDHNVLRSISLNFRAGKTTFLLGKSGSGKSSLSNLLLKFYENYTGVISVDGRNIKHIDQSQLIKNITVVEQRCNVFNGTLKENIIIGIDGADEEEILTKLKLVCRISLLENFIHDLSDGLNTLIGSGGISLSGGQQQKVAIARALMKDPQILILDESLSALDVLQRGLILRAIRTHRKEKTTIILTHELNQIGSNDFCYLIESGQCIEHGLEETLVNDPSTRFHSWKHLHDTYDHYDCFSQYTYVETPTTPKKFAADSRIDYEVETPKNYQGGSIFAENETLCNSSQLRRPKTKKERVLVTEKSFDEFESSSRPREKMISILEILGRMFQSSRNKLLLSFGLLFSLAAGAANPVFSYTFSYLLNGLAPQFDGVGSPSYLLKWSLIVIGVAIADAILNFLQYFLFGYCSEYWILQLRNQVMQRISFEELDWFQRERHKASEVSALLLNDLRDLRALASDFLIAVSSFAVVSSVGIIWALIIGWKLSLVCISMFPLIVIFSAVYGMALQRQETQYKSAVVDLENLLYEVATGIKTIRRLQLENNFLRQYKRLESHMRVIASRRAITTGLGVAVIEALAMSIQAILFYYALKLVIDGQYTTKKMFETLTLLLFTIMTCNILISQVPDISRGQRAANRILQMLDEKLEREKPHQEKKQTISGSVSESSAVISLQNVTFAYPSAPSIHIFDSLYLELPIGRTFALVGQSGSGKSTLVTLLTQLYRPTSGTVLVENKDVNEWNIRDLRRQMSAVEQTPTIFSGTVRENLLYGLHHDPLEVEMYDVLRYVGIHDFISKLPLGLDTSIDIDLLSGGQLQRLCIARAILKRPKILILDECTSALDPFSSHVINNIVRRGCPAPLTISITHNVDMMKACDEIIFLKNGRVAGTGSFDALLQSDKTFRALIADEH